MPMVLIYKASTVQGFFEVDFTKTNGTIVYWGKLHIGGEDGQNLRLVKHRCALPLLKRSKSTERSVALVSFQPWREVQPCQKSRPIKIEYCRIGVCLPVSGEEWDQ